MIHGGILFCIFNQQIKNEAPRLKMVPSSGVSLCNILEHFPIRYAMCCAVCWKFSKFLSWFYNIEGSQFEYNMAPAH